MNRLAGLTVVCCLLLSAAVMPASAAGPIEDSPPSNCNEQARRSISTLVHSEAPPLACTASGAPVGDGCDLLSTRCPTWVSSHDEDGVHDVPGGDVVALSPNGSTAFLGVTAGARGVRLLAVDVASGQQRWATPCCEPINGSASADKVAVSRDGSKVFVAGWIQHRDDPFLACTGFVQAFDADSGQRLWRARQRASELCWTPTDILAAPGGRLFVSSANRFTDGTLGGRIHRINSTTGRRRLAYRTRVYSDRSGRTATVDMLRISPDGRHVVAAGTFGETPPGSEFFDAAGWFLRRLRITERGLSRDWSLVRRTEPGRTNPLAGFVMAGRRRVIITGNTLIPFRAFTIGVNARNGRRLWTQRQPVNSQPWRHAPLATRSGKVFLTFLGWSQGVGMDEANQTVALDARTGEELWGNSFRSLTQTTATSYDWSPFPMLFTAPSTPHLYQVLRGYGSVEVRALDPSTGSQLWYSNYGDGYRSLAGDGQVTPDSGALLVGVINVPEQQGSGRSQLLRLDP